MKSIHILLAVTLVLLLLVTNYFSYVGGYFKGYVNGSDRTRTAVVNWYNTNIFGPIVNTIEYSQPKKK